MNVQFFDHAHHKLKIRGLKSPVDVLTFTGHEQLSSPFRYDIEFTSTDKAIEPESVLMQDGAFSLSAPPVQGMPVQVPLRTLHGVITGFKHLSSSQDEARYEVRLEPRMALLTRAARTPSTRTRRCRKSSKKSCASAIKCAVRTSCLTSKTNTRPVNR